MSKTKIEFFDSIGDFRRVLDTIKVSADEAEASEWKGGESWDDAKRNLLKGKLEAARAADKLMDKLAGEAVELETTQWEQSVAGYFPCVPAYVAGFPDAMWNQAQVTSDRAPVRVFASVCVSAGVDAEDLEKRGVAILALCQKLQSVRPVELFVYADMGGSGYALMPCIKIETSPLDLATATYALSAAGFLRQLCFGWANKHGWSGQWAWGTDPRDKSGQRKTREALRLTDTDLLVPGGYSEDPLIKRPIEWINEQVAKYTTALEAA
jgi:hypothetical protein